MPDQWRAYLRLGNGDSGSLGLHFRRGRAAFDGRPLVDH